MDAKTIIGNAAKAHGLPAALVAAVVAVESGGNAWSFRFEPSFFERALRRNRSVRAVGPCSLDTERQARATSWGLMQVMGDTARALGFDGPYLAALACPETGLEFGCRLLARCRDLCLASHGWPGVAAAYNNGTPALTPEGRFVNQAYVDRIAQAMGGAWPA